MNRKNWIVPVALIAVIAFVAVFFYYPVYIENALTLQPEPDFEIQVLGLFAIYTLVKSFRLKGKIRVKRFLVSQLLNLPVLVGLWFAFFVILIFVPLHNDKIINKTTDWVLVNTHSQTEFSHDGVDLAGRIVEMAPTKRVRCFFHHRT